MNKKKIILISVNADPLGTFGLENQGGQNKRILELCKNLTINGWTIDVFTSHYKNASYISKVNSCFNVHRISTGSLREYDDNNFTNEELESFLDNLLIVIKNRQITFDYLICFYWISGIIGIRLQEKIKMDFGISFCSLGAYKTKRSKKINLRITKEKEIAQKASYIIAQSNHEKEILVNRYNANPNKIKIIPGGINDKIFYPKNKKILFVGRPVKQKGLSDLLDALLLIQDFNWELGIIGKNYPEVISLNKYKNLSNRIYQHGVMSNGDVAKLMREYDILVVPSRYENFGNVALEGMASGMIVIASKVNGLGELIEHKVNGLHCEPMSDLSIANQLKFALTNELAQLRKEAVLFSKSLNWDILIKKYETILIDK